jgi:acyl-CoA thioesterase-2
MTDAPRRWALDDFLGLFELEDLGAGVYKATNPARGPWTRVFGGQVIAQAIRSAQLTVPAERAIHSAHAYFIRPGKVGEPIYFHVERPRDGRSFTTRYVKAAQGPEVIFDMIASFHVTEDGAEFQVPRAVDVPLPEDAPEPEMPLEFRGRMRSMMPFDMRELGPQAPEVSNYRSTRRVWFRTNGPLPDDPALHACVLAFASDMGTVSAARAPSAGEDMWATFTRFMSASLDHAIWFHRPVRADEWILMDLRAISNHGARGLAMGTMHTQDGVLGVSIAQEALIRPLQGEGPRQS